MNRRFKKKRTTLSLSLSIFPPFLSFLSLGQGDAALELVARQLSHWNSDRRGCGVVSPRIIVHLGVVLRHPRQKSEGTAIKKMRIYYGWRNTALQLRATSRNVFARLQCSVNASSRKITREQFSNRFNPR